MTENVFLTLASAAKLSSPSTFTLTVSGATFNNFGGSLLVNYKARTTQVGSATLTLKASSDFSPAGGPSVASGNVTYTCASAGLGTACSGTQTMNAASQTSVVSVSTNACVGTGCSSANPASVQLQFVLANSPQYHTGSYSAQVLFTFSSI
ncbi:MAG TPA: hypothetical protein VEU96_11980 [Bryobacteraceae bacterium]|nr:hypothetical protein [Bryobacteraceae bacterium]